MFSIIERHLSMWNLQINFILCADRFCCESSLSFSLTVVFLLTQLVRRFGGPSALLRHSLKLGFEKFVEVHTERRMAAAGH